MKKPDQDESLFITKEVTAEIIANDHEFKPPLIACTVRLRNVLEAMLSWYSIRARSSTRSASTGSSSHIQVTKLKLVCFVASL